MLLTISFLSSLAGVGLAGAAALLPDTGINGTLGAFLAVAGAVTVAVALGLLVAPVRTARGLITAGAALVAILTALAAWFLMQEILLATMVLAFVALLASVITADRKAKT